MRKKLLLGNWKMNKTRPEAKEFAEGCGEMVEYAVAHGIDVGVAPTFVCLCPVIKHAPKELIVAAQNVNENPSGAYTGEISIPMLQEICTGNGRIDMMVAAGDWIYVIEFKLSKSADQAMRQIENKDYAVKFRKEGKRIMLLGVNFDSEAGNITDWIKEEYRG